MTRTHVVGWALFAMLVAACSEAPTDGINRAPGAAPAAHAAVPGSGIAVNAIVELVGDIAEVRMDATTAHTPDLSDADLVSAIGAAGGRAYVAFKPPTAPRTKVSRVFPAMSRAFALSARGDIIARGARLLRTFPTSGTIVVEVPPELGPVLRQLPFVNYVEPVRELRIAAQDTAWGVKKIGAPTIWTDYNNRGEYATISFLDTGIDQTHFGIELPATGDCYYDGIYFTSCFDDNGHGSHVIGIATAQSNSSGMIGVSHSLARLATFKVCNSQGGCFDDAVASALYFLETQTWPRHIISMSLGAPTVSTEMKQSLARLYNAGVLLVAAAGNNPNDWGYTGVFEPAATAEVIAVSGTLEDDSFATSFFCDRTLSADFTSGSNFGPDVEISAPFHALSTVLAGQIDRDCGTSMATPVVSATAALVWSQNTSWTNAQVRSWLRAKAVDLGAPGQFGYGRVDAAAAAAPAPPPPSVSIVGPAKVRPNITCSWQASVSGGAPPFTYYWTQNGAPVGTSSVVTTSFASSGTLAVQVYDAALRYTSASKSITVLSSAPICQV